MRGMAFLYLSSVKDQCCKIDFGAFGNAVIPWIKKVSKILVNL